MADLFTTRTTLVALGWAGITLVGVPTSSLGGLLGRVVAALLVVGAVKFVYVTVKNRGDPAAA